MSYPPNTLEPPMGPRARRSVSDTRRYVPDGYPVPAPPASQGFAAEPWRQQHRPSFSTPTPPYPTTPNDRRSSYGARAQGTPPVQDIPQEQYLQPTYPNPPTSDDRRSRPPRDDELQRPRHSRSHSRHSTRSNDSRRSHHSHHSHHSHKSHPGEHHHHHTHHPNHSHSYFSRSYSDDAHDRKSKHHHHHDSRKDSHQDDDDDLKLKRRDTHRVTLGDTVWAMFSSIKDALGPRDKY